MTLDRRQSPRSRVLQGASVIFNGRQSVMDCRIRNRSERGMMLRMTDWIALPDVFEVQIAGQPEARLGRLCWRRGDDLGVSFADDDKQQPASNVSYAFERRLLACKAEDAALKERLKQLSEG